MTAVREIIVDSFAGAGGASHGIELALGRSPDIAINHNPAAITMHAANHPRTKHFTEDVFKVSPRVATGGKPVGLLWASPDCRHFSRAKGGKPVEKRIRGLAWAIVKWAVEVAPRVIVMENVREFEEWGPLVPRWDCAACGWKGTEGQAVLARRGGRRKCPRCESVRLKETSDLVPDPDRKGWTFRQFVGRIKAQGYHVEWKALNAADFGAPTHRRRLFLVARNDGEPIVWPDFTHGDPKKIGGDAASGDLFSGGLKPWRTAAECIDWSIPCPSIFDRKKPLKEKTLRRIAMGIKRYVLDNPKPFIVDMQRTNRARGVDEPAGTVTTQGNKFNLVSPVVAPLTHDGDRRATSPDEPLPTVTSANRGEQAVILPHLTKFREGAVGSGIDEPVPTVTANSFVKRPGGAPPIGLVEVTAELATPVIAKIGQTGSNGACTASVESPVTTIVSKAEHLVVAPVIAHLAHGEGKDGRWGRGAGDAQDPLGTIHSGGKNFAVVAPVLVGDGGSEYSGKPREADRPMGTLTANPRAALVSAFIAKHFGGVVGHAPEQPLGTVTAVDHHSAVDAKLAPLTFQRYGEFANQTPRCGSVENPLNTVTATNNSGNLAVANLIHLNHGEKTCSAADEPARTVTAGGQHAALVYSLMVKYFGQGVGVEVDVPCPTITSKDRFGLVTVTIEGEPYVIVDIGMRMLKPRELARAQGFPDSYLLTGTATNQVARIGNSVCPPVAQAIVAANVKLKKRAPMAAGRAGRRMAA